MHLRLSLRSSTALLAFVVLAEFISGPTHSEDRLAAVTLGKAVFFNRCIACHEPPSTVGLTKDELARNEAALPADEKEATPERGPSLAALLGRRAGTLPGYHFSDAMKSADLIWTEHSLRLFLLKPVAFIPKTKMAFNGLKREGEMENLIAYLKEAAK